MLASFPFTFFFAITFNATSLVTPLRSSLALRSILDPLMLEGLEISECSSWDEGTWRSADTPLSETFTSFTGTCHVARCNTSRSDEILLPSISQTYHHLTKCSFPKLPVNLIGTLLVVAGRLRENFVSQ
jgi:hypothetical protein